MFVEKNKRLNFTIVTVFYADLVTFFVKIHPMTLKGNLSSHMVFHISKSFFDCTCAKAADHHDFIIAKTLKVLSTGLCNRKKFSLFWFIVP